VSPAQAPAPAGRAEAVTAASAPGRLCLAGESLDWMTGGPSVTAAIPLRTRVTAWRARGSDALTLSSGAPLYRTRLVPPARAAAARYAADELDHMQAAARVTLHDAARIAGVVLTASTDLPVGAGTSSSAALTLAAVTALAALAGTAPGRDQACELARQAEAGELGTGAGWMDFLACAHGGVNRIQAAERRAERIAPSMPVPLVLIDTRQRRATATVLASKRDRYRAREPAMLDYVAGTTRIVGALAAELCSPRPDYRQAGRLITAAHALLRDKARCSTPLIEECASRVLHAGAYGAKLSGSGHGGCLFAIVPDDVVASVLASLNGLPVHPVVLPRSDPDGLTCSAAARAPAATAGTAAPARPLAGTISPSPEHY
jgi:galactokinase